MFMFDCLCSRPDYNKKPIRMYGENTEVTTMMKWWNTQVIILPITSASSKSLELPLG